MQSFCRFERLSNLLTGTAILAAMVISQPAAVTAKTAGEMAQMTCPPTPATAALTAATDEDASTDECPCGKSPDGGCIICPP